MITVTPEAAKRLKSMLDKNQPNNPEAGIRLAVKAGGCSGFVYVLPFPVAVRPSFGDKISESNGIRIFVDPLILRYLEGTEIGYTSNLLEKGFTFNNPNAKTGCGCGTSFELK